MGFFNTVQYVGMKDNSAYGIAENAANVCRAPLRWLRADLGYESKVNLVCVSSNGEIKNLAQITEKQHGFRKAVRMIVSLVFLIPGEFLATSLMFSAYLSPEIRLKHSLTSRNLSDAEAKKLTRLINERQKLANERQGCEPFSCLLVTIVCLLCSISNRL